MAWRSKHLERHHLGCTSQRLRYIDVLPVCIVIGLEVAT